MDVEGFEGLDVGQAFVGNVGSGEVKDFTALGDVVNTASRLQSSAGAGQIVLSERLFSRLSAGAVESPHQSADEPLVERMRADQCLELRDELCVPAEFEIGLDPSLLNRKAGGLEPLDLSLRQP